MRRTPIALLALLVGNVASPAGAEPRGDACAEKIADFSTLGRRIAQFPQISEGDLLSIRLLRHTGNPCRLAFRIDVLSWRGSVMDFGFDASTLETVSLENSEEWIDADEDMMVGEGGEATYDDPDDEDDPFAEDDDDREEPDDDF